MKSHVAPRASHPRTRGRLPAVPRPLCLAVRAIITSLPMTGQITHGSQQGMALRALVDGTTQPCHTLDVAVADLVDRAKTREDADQVLLIAETMKLQWEARIVAKFGARPLDFPAASLAEQQADGVVDCLQVEAATPGVPVGTLYRLRNALIAQLHRAGDLLHATDRTIAERESARHAHGWS